MSRLTTYKTIAVGAAAFGGLWVAAEMLEAPEGAGQSSLAEVSDVDYGESMAWRTANPFADLQVPAASAGEVTQDPDGAETPTVVAAEVDDASLSTSPLETTDASAFDAGQAEAAAALARVAGNNNLGPADLFLEQIKTIACPWLSIMPPFFRDFAGQIAVWGGTTCPMGAAPPVSGVYMPGTGTLVSK
jgi:hypothetical protein